MSNYTPTSSAGAATAARVALERDLLAVCTSARRDFNAAVMADLDASYLAAAAGRHRRNVHQARTFDLSAVLYSWQDTVAGRLVARLADYLGLRASESLYLVGLQRQLATSEVPDQVYNRVHDAIEDGRAAGQSLGQTLADANTALQAEAGWLGPLSRTEATRAYAYAAQQGLAAAGYGQCRWVAVMDQRTRPLHQELNGQVVNIGDRFSAGGVTDMPGEAPNCRCVLIGVD